MRSGGLSLIVIASMGFATAVSSASTTPIDANPIVTTVPGEMPSTSEWSAVGQTDDTVPGFAPLSVTSGGVAYSPPATTVDGGGSANEVPAWASTLPKPALARGHDRFNDIGRLRFGSLPEPAAWVMILVGVGMIGGALRGLLVANQRLKLLQLEEETPGETKPPSTRP